MNAMPASPLFRSLALAAAALALAAALGGCATSGSKTGMDDAVSAGLITPDNETDARRRARTRLALAASYFENGQTAVALSELKQVLQIDPTFPDAYNLSGLIRDVSTTPKRVIYCWAKACGRIKNKHIKK